MARSKSCPNKKSKQWLSIVKKVGIFEAYRMYIRNDYQVPNHVFKTSNDVKKYLSFIPQLKKQTNKDTGEERWYIPYGRDYGTWTTNSALVHTEVNRINEAYGPLLVIHSSKPKAEQSIVEKGRTKVEWITINDQALVEHYKVYEDPREIRKNIEDNGEKFIPDYEQRTAYHLKVTDALMKIKGIRKTIRLNDKANPYREINLKKLLRGKGVSDQQIDFIFDYMKENDIQSIDTEDLAVRLASEFAYTVESDIQEKFIGEPVIDYDLIEDEEGRVIEARPKTKTPIRPTSYYSNLTVPGGTNYTENEIRTPDITPSIKGHAQFSTDQGIGWFRSDELKNEKTRRILEIQSDLFQKGRGEDLLVEKPILDDISLLTVEEFNNLPVKAVIKNSGNEFVDVKNSYKDYKGKRYRVQYLDDLPDDVVYELNLKASKNKFLQLLNKDNNWVTFFIKSIVQDSAKKGYEKVLFPKGETAAKVEGHQTIADEILKLDKDLKELETPTFENQLRKQSDGRFVFTGSTLYYGASKDDIKSKILAKKQELKSQGIEKLKPIEAFYEIRVGNILKKIDPNIQTITDEHGNQWYEYTIKEDDLSKAFALQKESLFQQGEDKLDPENRKDFEDKKAIMLKTFPSVKEVIEDYNITSAGALEANGEVIRVNPKLWTRDTIGHEFGHLLIDIIGGMNSNLVKRARKQLIGTELEKKVFEMYSDLVYANDDRIDKEIVAWAIGQETDKIFTEEKDRATWINILNRILDRIKKFLHIDHNASRQLARIVLSGESVNKNSKLDVDAYEQRTAEEEIKDKLNKTRKGRTKIESLRDSALKALQHKYQKYRRRDIKSKIEVLKQTIDKIEQLDNNPIEGLKLFRDFAVQQTKQVYNRYAYAKSLHEAFLRGEERGKQLTLEELERWVDYVSGFALLDELVILYESLLLESKDEAIKAEAIFGKDDESKEKMIKQLEEAVKQKRAIEEGYVKDGLQLAAEKLAPFSKHIEAEFNEAAAKDYQQLSKEEKNKITIDEYKLQRIGANKEDIRRLTVEKLQEEMQKASKDINVLQRWLESPFHSSDVVGSTMASAVVDAHFKAREETIKLEDELLSKVKALEDFYKNKGILKDIKQSYDFMLEKGDDGHYTQHIVSPYKTLLWEQYESYKKKLDEKELSYDEKQDLMKQWKREHMPIDSRLFNLAKDEFYKELIEKGIITTKHKEELNINDHWSTVSKKEISDIVSDDAAEIIHEWFRENLWKYRKPLNVYRNPQFKELVKLAGGSTEVDLPEQIKAVEENKSKDPRIDFYNFITKTTNKVQKGTPYGYRIHTRLPSVMKSTGERAAAGQSISDVLGHTFNSTLNVLADESERGDRIITNEAGDPVHFIPVYYTTNLNKYYATKFDDVVKKKGLKFNSTTEYYAAKEEFIKEEAEKNQSYDLGSIYARYFDSAINYKHKYNILPEMEFALKMVKDRTLADRDVKGLKSVFKAKKKEKAENLAKQIGDWHEALIYGVKQKDEGALFGGKVDAAKAANTLNSFTAISLLGLNFVQGTANALLGSAMQVIESAGGEDYNVRELARANVFYGKNLPGILGDVGLRKPKNIVSLLLRKFDILNEYDKPEFRKTSKFHQLFRTNSLFVTSQAGEHWMQTKPLLAMLIRMRAKDASGTDIGNMLEQFYVENGTLKINDKVSNFSPKDQAVFETKVRKKLASMHGDYSPFGLVAAQRYAAGRMGYMFRKFIIPGVKRRYQGKQVDNSIGEYVEGYYRTMGRFTAKLVKDLKDFQFAMMATDWNSLTPNEQANFRKALTEILFLTASIVMSYIFIGLKEGDDDDDWIWSFLGYQSLRFKTELLFFSPKLDETLKILRSPAASMSVIENLIRFYSQLLPPDFEGFERYERGNWKGRFKISKTTTNFVPGLKQIYRLKYIEDQISWFN